MITKVWTGKTQRGTVYVRESGSNTRTSKWANVASMAIVLVALLFALAFGAVLTAEAQAPAHGLGSASRCWLYSYTSRYADSEDFVESAPHCWVVEGKGTGGAEDIDEDDNSSIPTTPDTITIDTPVVVPPTDTIITVVVDDPVTPDTNTPDVVDKDKKEKCNKGGGNGSEGCDPGGNPNKGNDDEDGAIYD